MTEDDELTALVNALRRDRRRDPYAGRREYSRAARSLAGHCERLLAAGEPGVVVPVLRKAVDRMTAALTSMDDSSGAVGADLREMMSLYARACAAAPPSPVGLAGWLVKLAYEGPGWPEIRLAEFAPALGERGVAELGVRVAERDAATEAGSWGQVFATRDLREQLAEISGDVDRYVAVLAEHLTSAAQYRRIVAALRDAGRPGEAVDWARRGLAADRGGPYADRLRDDLVDLLVETGDLDEACAERQAEFEHRPTAKAYRALVAIEARCAAGPGLGGWAVGVLRDRVIHQPAYVAELVAVLLAEGESEQAWRVGLDHVEALPEGRLVELLELRRRSRPADVLGPYRALVDARLLDSGDKHRYRNAIGLLRNLRAAFLDLGDAAGFDAYVDQLRTEHKRRPTFLAQLDAAGL